MKKSIIISYNYPPVVGGIETYAFELISFLKRIIQTNMTLFLMKLKNQLRAFLEL